jgi:hypothetical protein
MALPLATIADLEVRLGEPIGSLEGTDLARAQAALSDASTLVRLECGASWADPTEVPEGVWLVTVGVALRVYRNPSGLRSETVGDYSWSTDPAGTLTADERALLKAAMASAGGAGVSSGALSLRTRSAYAEPVLESDWLPEG